jgi:hypothetical protein
MLKRAIGLRGNYVPPSAPPEGRNYYISSNGTGLGLVSSDPAPLSVLLAATLTTNDSIYFNCGDEFVIENLVLSNLYNIQISSFGTGAQPIIYGSTYLGDATWVDNGDGMFYTSLPTEPKWVWRNGIAARLAESAWITIDDAPSTTVRSIAAATLSAMSSVVGAKLIFKEWNFRATELYEITAQDNATGHITFTPALSSNSLAAVNLPLKIINQAQFMTTEGDWYYDSSSQRLYVKSAVTPAGTNIRITAETSCLEFNNVNNLTISHIDVRHAANNMLLLTSCVNATINDCNLHDLRGSAVRILGNSADLSMERNNIYNCGLRGIEHAGVIGGYISENNIYNIGTQANIGYPYDTNKTGGTAITLMVNTVDRKSSRDFTIEKNVMYNLGYQGLHWVGCDLIFQKNIIHDFCLKWNDGGAIHTIYRTTFIDGTSNCLFDRNIIYNGIGNLDGVLGGTLHAEGIYIDNGCNNCTVSNNTVFDMSDCGILINWDTKTTVITNNNVIDAVNYQVWIRQDTDTSDSPVFALNNGNVLTGNVLGCRSASQRCVVVKSFQTSSTYNPFSNGGDSDSNKYIQPYGTSINTYTSASTNTEYTLATWRTKMSDDVSSTERVNYIVFSNASNAAQEVKIETNPTDSPVDFVIPVGYMQSDGTVGGTITIPAWGSAIYLKQTAYP